MREPPSPGIVGPDLRRTEVGTVSTAPSTYWDDLAEDLKDPEFRREYIAESLRVSRLDQLVNDQDESRSS